MTLADRSHPGESGAQPLVTPAERGRVRALVDSHHEFVWRTLRRLGVSEVEVDDAVQDVFLAVSRRIGIIEVGREAQYLFGIVTRVAANRRRALARQRESVEESVGARACGAPTAEQLVDQKRARELLDEILLTMAAPLRAVFILYELDDFEVGEIAKLMGIPTGTVASRLRRARTLFLKALGRYEARSARRGGTP